MEYYGFEQGCRVRHNSYGLGTVDATIRRPYDAPTWDTSAYVPVRWDSGTEQGQYAYSLTRVPYPIPATTGETRAYHGFLEGERVKVGREHGYVDPTAVTSGYGPGEIRQWHDTEYVPIRFDSGRQTGYMHRSVISCCPRKP